MENTNAEPKNYDVRFEALVGEAIGDYVIDAVLGQGGQAVVFKAHGTTGVGVYALKVFGLIDTASDPIHLQNALEEAKKQSRINHPAVVPVYVPGLADIEFEERSRGVLYIPMLYASLGSCNENPPFTAAPLASNDIIALINLLDALSEIHRNQIVHRDIKPANILRFEEKDNQIYRPAFKITDFGMAKVQFEIGGFAAASGLTTAYMSPEQLDEHGTPESDVYSMGATLYYMLTGAHPISPPADPGPDPQRAWQEAHREARRPNVLERNLFCHPRIALLVMQMMDVAPARRPSLAHCIDVLRACLDRMNEAAMNSFRPPRALADQIAGQEYSINYAPEFRGVFFPSVHKHFATDLFVIRIRMAHPLFQSYRQLITVMAQRFADCFCLHEAYGAFDVHIQVWSDSDKIRYLMATLAERFPSNEIEISRATGVHHLHAKERPHSDTPSMVEAIAIQDDIPLDRIVTDNYLCDHFPSDVPEHSIRAFTYVQSTPVPGTSNDYLRLAILERIKQQMRFLLGQTVSGRKHHVQSAEPRRFPRLSVIELTPFDPTTAPMDRPIALINFVARDYKFVHEVPTAVIELGTEAVKTFTYLETRRIVIQSDKILI